MPSAKDTCACNTVTVRGVFVLQPTFQGVPIHAYPYAPAPIRHAVLTGILWVNSRISRPCCMLSLERSSNP